MQDKKNSSKKIMGIWLVVMSTICFSIGGVCVKMGEGLSPLALNSGRCAVAAMFTGSLLAITHHKVKINYSVIIGAVSLCLTGAFYIFAVNLSSAANAIILQYTSPIFCAIYLWIAKNKKPTTKKMMCILVVFSGTVLCCAVRGAVGSGAGNIFGILSGVSFAGVFLSGGMKKADPMSAFFLGQLLSAIIGLPFLITAPITSRGVGAMLVMGLVQMGFAYALLSAGMCFVDSLTANLICAVEPVMNTFLVAVFYAEIPSFQCLVGSGLVVAGVIAYNLADYRKTGGIKTQKR